ncbi:MAG: 3-oxoacyl-ACP reductase family protein [Nanoarchaeota archaeon]|nr:3-oxoacyl-ACP reductase FabG [Nanoarchaeota archaeon]MBU4300286.1 3-oxoacyl-ACP reductase FabG [Nanoarchaeota archaeon]MBU4452501.1 3-oxoacyl-ACP reductase FabG [Nanoarchaeota archaeon]MCG2723206.1 3-oxoacyl-ACP reductase FabG [archaeon]
MKKLEGRVAVITGSSRGIGRAIALEFAKEGAKIIINYIQSKKEAEEVVAEIKKLGSDALAMECDVSDEKQVNELISTAVKKFGKIDILINNAGIVAPKPFQELMAQDWENILRVNLIGTFLCSKAAAPHMLHQKYGKIVNVSSIRGLECCGRAGILDYSASKAGVINFTKTLAKELAPHVNVNSVAPGLTETDQWKNKDASFVKAETEKTLFKRFARPEEIAKAALFLASDDSSYITGDVLIVDGGYHLRE